MARSAEHVVRRIQRRLGSAGSIDRPSPPTPSELAELEARIRRLRAMDGGFIHAGLSEYVAQRSATEVPTRVGGECVATEV